MKRFTPDSLIDIAYVSEPSLSPDGRQTAFTRYTADANKNEFVPHVYVVDNQTGRERRLTERPANRPQMAVARTYYLSEGQVWVNEGGRDMPLTSFRHGARAYSVSKGGRIACEITLYPGEEAVFDKEMSAEERRAWEEKKKTEPIIAQDFIYKLDSAFGVLDGSTTVIAVTDGAASRLVSPPNCHSPAWSEAGDILAFYGRPYDGTNALNEELYAWDGSEARQLTRDESVYPDGAPVFAGENPVFTTFKTFEDGSFAEWLNIRRGEESVSLFDENLEEIFQGVNCMPISRSVYGEQGPLMQYFGGYVYFISCFKGDSRLFRAAASGSGEAERVETGGISVHSFALRPDGSVIFVGGDMKNIADLYLFDGKLTRLTQSNPWLNECELARVHELKLSYGGDCWVMEPVGRVEGAKYPAVLDIHGGPECCYARDFWHELRAFSDAGLAVIWCNPRGGMGYGREATRPGGWGSEAWDDFMQAVELACELGFIDSSRVGVTGGSYGGYMTVKLVSRSKRFRAAAAQRPLCNTATSYGTGDMGFASARTAPERVDMREYLMNRAEKSLINRVDDIDAPMLILHGYKDYRCGFEQAEQLFVSLHERKSELPVRLVMFPEENHGVTRTGKPLSQTRHLRELCEWFTKYLSQEAAHE